MERKQLDILKKKLKSLKDKRRKENKVYENLINNLKRQINNLERIILNKKPSR